MFFTVLKNVYCRLAPWCLKVICRDLVHTAELYCIITGGSVCKQKCTQNMADFLTS